MVEGKRKNFTDTDDALLLKQIIADEPFKGGYGKVMEKWQHVADALNASDVFSRDNLSAMTAQNRFNLLLESARNNNKKAAKSSGVSKEYELKHELLGELLLLVDEHRHAQAKTKEKTRAKALASEKAGEVVRDRAVQRLKRRDPPGEDESTRLSQSPNKFAKLAEVLREHKEKELELRREQWKQERQDRLPPRHSAARTSNAFCKCLPC